MERLTNQYDPRFDHLGTLKRAHFDMKTFANEICRFICESVSDQIKATTLFSAIPPRLFSDFQWYFGGHISSSLLLSFLHSLIFSHPRHRTLPSE